MWAHQATVIHILFLPRISDDIARLISAELLVVNNLDAPDARLLPRNVIDPFKENYYRSLLKLFLWFLFNAKVFFIFLWRLNKKAR